jgi:hypothetical protein
LFGFKELDGQGTFRVRSAAEIAFTDRAGVHWVRRGGGQLAELSENPFEYFGRYGLTAPYELQTPEPL